MWNASGTSPARIFRHVIELTLLIMPFAIRNSQSRNFLDIIQPPHHQQFPFTFRPRSGAMKKTTTLFATALFLFSAISVFAREARLVRYPHYHNGRIVFTYLGDIWTADENGQNVQRLTVNRARDVYGRFSPDGKWIAFSRDRNGNLDVFLIPSGGATAKQLPTHSAD